MRRLFDRFAEIYGAQKAAAMWADVGIDRIVPVWAEALGKFDHATFAAAVKALPERESMWPPTLPEMMALCREAKTPEMHRPALPVPGRTVTQIADGRKQVEKLMATIGKPAAGDPLRWAYRVIERYEGGDTVVAHASYKFAIEALQNTGRLPAKGSE